MAVPLAQAAEVSQDQFYKGVIETIVTESHLLSKLPFVTIKGNAHKIVLEDADNPSTVGWYAPNGVWVEDTAELDTVTYSLTILGGDADVDKFIQETMDDQLDHMATQVELKSKQVSRAYERVFVYGDESGTNEFDGLHKIITGGLGQQVHCGTGANPGPLDVLELMEAIDSLEGKADAIMMNRELRRYVMKYLMAHGSYETERDEFGRVVEKWNDIPIMINNFITFTEALVDGAFSARTGGASTSIFALKFGEGDGIVGMQNGKMHKEEFDKLESKNALRTRLVWYCGMGVYSPFAVARVDGISKAAMTNE